MEIVAIVFVIGLVFGVIALIAWLSFIASALTVIFTEFVMRLPLVISLLMFVLFPPTLIVFLSGFFMIHSGIADKLAEKINKSDRS